MQVEEDSKQRAQAHNTMGDVDDMFYKAFHASPAPSAITRLSDGCYIDINNSFLKVLGYDPEEVIGHTSAELGIWLNPEDRVTTYQMLRDYGAAHDLELQFRAKSGDIRVALFSAVQVAIGEEPCILSIALDITERKRAEEERAELLAREQRARREAEEAVRARDELLSIVSHDLKNPLAGVIGNVKLLKRRAAQLEDSGRDGMAGLVTRIDVAAHKMLGLLDELMDFGRLQAGRPLSLQRRSADLVALARKVTDEHRHITAIHQISFVANVPELVGQWDVSRLERALTNLLSNAIKYSPRGGEIVVTASCEEEGTAHYATLAVRDRGLGIPEGEVPHIFEWFRRAEQHARRISGAGIGLASALQVVQEHGGTITVESREGAGSTFTIKLPLA